MSKSSLRKKTPLLKSQEMKDTSLEIHKIWTTPLSLTKDENTSLESDTRWRNIFLESTRNELLFWITQRMNNFS